MDPAQPPRFDYRELFEKLAQRNLSLKEFACEVVLAIPDLSSEYCSELQEHLDILACARRFAAAQPQNETDHRLSVRVFTCLRIWDMAFQIQEDPTKRHSGSKNRSSLRLQAGKFAADSFDVTTLETGKLDFLCLLGACEFPPMTLEKFDKLYEKLPDGHKKGAVIRTRIQKWVENSGLSFLSVEKAEKRGFSDLDDAECGMYMSVEMS